MILLDSRAIKLYEQERGERYRDCLLRDGCSWFLALDLFHSVFLSPWNEAFRSIPPVR